MVVERNTRMCSERLAFYCMEHEGWGDTGPAPMGSRNPGNCAIAIMKRG